MGVTAIAEQVGVVPGTAFRSLNALELGGYVDRFKASTSYVSGETTKRLRQSVFARFHLRDVCLPFMRKLALETGETLTLTVPVGWYGVRIAVTPGTNAVRSSPALGALRYLHSDAATQAILAFMKPDRVSRYNAWLAAQEDGAILPMSAMDSAIVRKTGYVLEPTSFAPGKAMVAFPILWEGEAIASIAIKGPIVSLAEGADQTALAGWRQTIAEVEARVKLQPDLFRNPFAHIDPDTILMPVTEPLASDS
jgi:DNA-binding IclR family transcriptional regulator